MSVSVQRLAVFLVPLTLAEISALQGDPSSAGSASPGHAPSVNAGGAYAHTVSADTSATSPGINRRAHR
jgi:hypothetical protein